MFTHGKNDLLTMGQKYNVKMCAHLNLQKSVREQLVRFFWVTGLTLLFLMGPAQWVPDNSQYAMDAYVVKDQHPSKVNSVHKLVSTLPIRDCVCHG